MALLAAEPLVDWDWVGRHTDDIWAAFTEHLTLTGIAVGIGFAVALVLALAEPCLRDPAAGTGFSRHEKRVGCLQSLAHLPRQGVHHTNSRLASAKTSSV